MQGRVNELVTVGVEWRRNDRGQLVPAEVAGSGQARPANSCCSRWAPRAEAALLKNPGIESDDAHPGRAWPLHERQGVFAAGDCRRGQSLVV